MSKLIIVGALAILASEVMAANCPEVVGKGAGGQYPHLFEKVEFESQYNCNMTFSENPDIAKLNSRIKGNPELQALRDRLPAESLVIAPYTSIGYYGGVLDGISKATESGSSDVLSLRHVNLVRFNDDLETIVPNVAKSWQWNEDFTELTFTLRKGHKWSDGKLFTAHDIAFWYQDITLDTNIIEKPNARFMSEGKPLKVEALSDTVVLFTSASPKPGMLANLALDYAQVFLPKHLLMQFHPKYNRDADTLAQSLGFDSGYDVIKFYYGQSDWKDIPTPLLKDSKAAQRLVNAGFTAIMPTLESHLVVEDTLEGRRLVANPYFFQVDTAGQQLPYINEIKEIYIGDEDIQTTKLIAGEVDYKAQSVNLPVVPVLLENRNIGNYNVSLRPTIGGTTFAFNLTDKDEEKRAVFNDVNFRRAMSVAMNRNQINESAYFKLGVPTQYTAFDGDTASFVSEELKNKFVQYDPIQSTKWLDKAGVIDKDGDGFRDLPSGKKFELTIQYSTQGSATKVVEIVASNWTDVGIKTNLKEVTSDEYRNSQTANDLSVLVWVMGRPLATLASDNETLLPPYDNFFGLRTGMLWAQYRATKGAEGIKPPKTVDEMQVLADKFVTLPTGSEESNKLGAQIAEKVVDDLFLIGTVKTVAPVYSSKKLANFEVPKTSSYDYYRMYPYLPTQWYLNEDAQ